VFASIYRFDISCNTVLELAVLGLLHDGPRHGYELKQRCSEIIGPLWGVSFGSLYPALRRLERAGDIAMFEESDTDTEGGLASVAPMFSTGSIGGDLAAARRRRIARPGRRKRKAYRITEQGQATLFALLAADDDSAGDDRTFALKLAFCGYLNPEQRIALLQARRAQLVSRLSRSRRDATAPRATDRYLRSLLEHRNRATEHELAWVDQLIDDERSALTDRPEGATA
jgi:DNA-binding PadR family transcriptional regulator